MAVEEPVTLIVGDVAFFYDVNGLWLDSLPANLTVVVVNNGGGRIFDLITGPDQHPELASYQQTPHNRRAESISKEMGLNYLCAENFEELDHAVSEMKHLNGPRLLELVVNSSDYKTFYSEIKNFKT